METATQSEAISLHPRSSVEWKYLMLAFSISWVFWITAILLHTREEFLLLGSAGPALAALISSYRGKSDPMGRQSTRALVFIFSLAACWIVLSLQHPSRSNSTLNPWLIVPAILPAWIISAAIATDSGIRGLAARLVHVPSRWELIALLIFPAIILVPALVALLLHLQLVWPERSEAPVQQVTAGIIFFLYNLLFAALLEEPGWRGLLLDRLQARWSPLKASLVVWIAWALWHLPLDYFRPGGFSLAMFLKIRVIFLLPIVFIFTWLYNHSGRSIQATVVLHAAMNTFPFVLPYFMPGFALLFVIAAYVLIVDRMWTSERLSGQKEEF